MNLTGKPFYAKIKIMNQKTKNWQILLFKKNNFS